MNAKTMPVDRGVLAAYIREHGRTPMMEKFVMEVLEPFYKKAETGVYDLGTIDEVDPEEIRCALACATGKSASDTKLTIVSGGFGFWERRVSVEDTLNHYLYQDHDVHFGTYLWATEHLGFADRLLERIGGGRAWADCLPSVQSLLEPLERSLKQTVGGSEFGYCDTLWRIQHDPVFFFAMFALAGDVEMVTRLTPLMRVLAKCIIVCAKDVDPPNDWMVLVA